jgi:hypothetical protein
VSLATAYSWKHTPEVLRLADAPERIAAGDRGLAITLVKFIKDVWDVQHQAGAANGPPGPPPVRVEVANSASKSSYSFKTYSTLSNHASAPQLDTDEDSLESSSTETHQASVAQFYGLQNEIDYKQDVREAYINEDYSSQSYHRAPPISAARRADIILWLEAIGVVSASTATRRAVHSSAHAARRHERIDPLSDPWCNGVLLSELAAVLCKNGAKNLVKEVAFSS